MCITTLGPLQYGYHLVKSILSRPSFVIERLMEIQWLLEGEGTC